MNFGKFVDKVVHSSARGSAMRAFTAVVLLLTIAVVLASYILQFSHNDKNANGYIEYGEIKATRTEFWEKPAHYAGIGAVLSYALLVLIAFRMDRKRKYTMSV